MAASNNSLRLLPSIDVLLRTATAASLQGAIGLEHLSDLARQVTDELRQEIMATPGIEEKWDSREVEESIIEKLVD